MALEYLDLENKLYIPTQKLISQIQSDLLALFSTLRQISIETHDIIAELSKQWYDSPIETTQRWYQQALNFSDELYMTAKNEWLPQATTSYEHLLASTADLIEQTQHSLSYLAEHPEQISEEALEAVTDTLTATANISTELVSELQSKTAEIVALLLEHPLQTLETAYTETLSALLNGYFELVSTILASL